MNSGYMSEFLWAREGRPSKRQNVGGKQSEKVLKAESIPKPELGEIPRFPMVARDRHALSQAQDSTIGDLSADESKCLASMLLINIDLQQ
jgi:hypothetical protein